MSNSNEPIPYAERATIARESGISNSLLIGKSVQQDKAHQTLSGKAIQKRREAIFATLDANARRMEERQKAFSISMIERMDESKFTSPK